MRLFIYVWITYLSWTPFLAVINGDQDATMPEEKDLPDIPINIGQFQCNNGNSASCGCHCSYTLNTYEVNDVGDEENEDMFGPYDSDDIICASDFMNAPPTISDQNRILYVIAYPYNQSNGRTKQQAIQSCDELIDKLKAMDNDFARLEMIKEQQQTMATHEEEILFDQIENLPNNARRKWSSKNSAIYRHFDLTSVRVIFESSRVK